MAAKKRDTKVESAELAVKKKARVTRSTVPPARQYLEYRQYLRGDFFFSCAYCTMSEAEAQAIRFTIDHYDPRSARPDLEHDYSNLMYACDECNSRKGDRYPPIEARSDGHRFFRPDEDIYEEHFERRGLRLEPKTSTGKYTILAVDLNRQALRRLRDFRERLTKCDELVTAGVLALRKFHIDQLPKNIRGPAVRSIMRAVELSKSIPNEIDLLLKQYARSELIDDDPEAKARADERKVKLSELEALYPGNWRGRRSR